VYLPHETGVSLTTREHEDEFNYIKFNIGERISEGFILGDPMQMGQLPPPTLLEAQESF
jgi:hypothetical protein